MIIYFAIFYIIYCDDINRQYFFFPVLFHYFMCDPLSSSF